MGSNPLPTLLEMHLMGKEYGCLPTATSSMWDPFHEAIRHDLNIAANTLGLWFTGKMQETKKRGKEHVPVYKPEALLGTAQPPRKTTVKQAKALAGQLARMRGVGVEMS